MDQQAIRERFSAALDALVEQVKDDRSILAAHPLRQPVARHGLGEVRHRSRARDGRRQAAKAVGPAALRRRRQRPRVAHAARRVPQDGRGLAAATRSCTRSWPRAGCSTRTTRRSRDSASGCRTIGARDTRAAAAARRRRTRWRPSTRRTSGSSPAATSTTRALWILYAATPLAQIEVIARAAARRPRGHPAGADAQPVVLQDRSTPTCSTRRRRRKAVAGRARRRRRLPGRRAPRRCSRRCSTICARSARRGRASDIEDHFKRHFDVGGVTTACEYLADQRLIGKASAPVRLTKNEQRRGAGAGVLLHQRRAGEAGPGMTR